MNNFKEEENFEIGFIIIYVDAKRKIKFVHFRQRGGVSSSIVAIIIFGIRTGNEIVY